MNSCLFRNQAGGSNNNLDAKKLEEQFAKLNLEITALKQEVCRTIIDFAFYPGMQNC